VPSPAKTLAPAALARSNRRRDSVVGTTALVEFPSIGFSYLSLASISNMGELYRHLI
jgi:hypothetical protein